MEDLMKRTRPPARDAIRQTVITGLFLLTLLLAGCVALLPELSWVESYTIQKAGRCQLRYVRHGNDTTCREYRC
jgi:hypothetical protein